MGNTNDNTNDNKNQFMDQFDQQQYSRQQTLSLPNTQQQNHRKNLTFEGNSTSGKNSNNYGELGKPAVPGVSKRNQSNDQSRNTNSFVTQQNITRGPQITTQGNYTQITQNFIEPSPGTYGNRFTMTNILSIFNDQTKEIFKVRVNPVMTLSGLKQRIAAHYKIDKDDVIIIFKDVRYDSLYYELYGDNKEQKRQRKVNPKVSRTPSPSTAIRNMDSKLKPQQFRMKKVSKHKRPTKKLYASESSQKSESSIQMENEIRTSEVNNDVDENAGSDVKKVSEQPRIPLLNFNSPKMKKQEIEFTDAKVNQFNLFCCTNVQHSGRSGQICCCNGNQSSPNLSLVLDSPQKAPKNQKICIRNDLLIFQDIGISEETLVQTIIRGSTFNGSNPNNMFTSHNVHQTSQNQQYDQTIPSDRKSLQSSNRKIRDSNLKVREKVTYEEDEYLKNKYSELNQFLKGRKNQLILTNESAVLQKKKPKSLTKENNGRINFGGLLQKTFREYADSASVNHTSNSQTSQYKTMKTYHSRQSNIYDRQHRKKGSTYGGYQLSPNQNDNTSQVISGPTDDKTLIGSKSQEKGLSIFQSQDIASQDDMIIKSPVIINQNRQTFTHVTGQKQNHINNSNHKNFEPEDSQTFSRNFNSLPKKGKSTSYKMRGAGSFQIKQSSVIDSSKHPQYHQPQPLETNYKQLYKFEYKKDHLVQLNQDLLNQQKQNKK